IWRIASTMFWPSETRTSTCRNFATISSGLYRFLAIAVLLDVKDIPQVGPLQRGRITEQQGFPEFSVSLHGKQNVQCADCHMGALGQRMTKTTGGPHSKMAAFDVSFHGMKIALPTPGNPPFASEARGSCQVCHTDQRIQPGATKPAPPKTPAELFGYVRTIQEEFKKQIDAIEERIKSNKATGATAASYLSHARD